MDLKVHCPTATCRATLTVPISAAGHVARCPLCHATFLVPSEEDIAEQTASSWIEDDIDDLAEEIDNEWQQRLKDEAVRRAREEEHRRNTTAREIEKIMATHKQLTHEEAASMAAAAMSTQSTATVDEPAAQQSPQRPLAPAANVQSAPTQTQEETLDTATVAPTQPQPTPVAQSNAVAVSTPEPAQAASEPQHLTIAPKQVKAPRQSHKDAYPSELVVTEPRPYLLVSRCTQSGVELTFNSNFLKHDGFRLSMPLACAFTGESDRAKLIARPLAFLDQARGEIRNAYDIEAGHEAKLTQSITGKEMLSRMGVIEQLPEPFRFPFPYYVRTDHSNMSIKCTTSKKGEGPLLAHVTIPDGPMALRWLRHVNGVCGREYDLLSRDVAHLWQNEWTGLDETVRRRLEVWAHFMDGEKFRYFINDADMPKKDEGLAGVVLTDRRLIYKKFHRQGQVEFGTNAQLIIRADGTMAGLRVKTEDGTFKCARFHFDDLQKLKDAASDLGFGLDIAK